MKVQIKTWTSHVEWRKKNCSQMGVCGAAPPTMYKYNTKWIMSVGIHTRVHKAFWWKKSTLYKAKQPTNHKVKEWQTTSVFHSSNIMGSISYSFSLNILYATRRRKENLSMASLFYYFMTCRRQHQQHMHELQQKIVLAVVENFHVTLN